MDRLITPLDGSRFAEAALEATARLAEQFDATIDLVHVVEPESPGVPPSARAMTEAGHYLDEVASHCPARVPVRKHVLQGRPVDELLRFFRAAGDAIVVMSRFGHTSLRRSRFGGVADSLVHGGELPVLLIDSTHPNRAYDLNEILVPLDGSELAGAALPYAAGIAGKHGRICLINVIQPPDERTSGGSYPPSANRDHTFTHEVAATAVDAARNFLFQTATSLRRKGTTVSWEVRFGEPGSEILRACETSGADLIVITTRGLGGERRWRLDSVTDVVIRGSATPVLVIPPPRTRLAKHASSGCGSTEAR